MREQIIHDIDAMQEQLIRDSHEIHDHPETGNEEVFASALLMERLRAEGFQVRQDIAGHPTGFIAEKASSTPGPVIGYLAEYDALEGLGHGCGHNIIGVASVGAAIALGRQLETVGGTVRVFGTPAEEGGVNGSAKASYAAAGVFDGTDVAMMVHPSSYTQRSAPAIAVAPTDFEFFGKSAHASAAPHEGINALDAMILFYNGIGALRQQLEPDNQIHGIILDGGQAANIIPDYTKARFYMRASTGNRLRTLIEKVYRIADGAAAMTGTTVKYTPIQKMVENLVPNRTLDEVFVKQMESIGEPVEPKIKKIVGSSDTGNASHVLPTIQPTIAISDVELAPHSVEFREAAGSEKGERAVILSAKALALTGLAVLQDPELLKRIQEEFRENPELRM